MKVLSKIFIILAILLSNVMCAVVAYNYCSLEWGAKYAGYSAPPGAPLAHAIPYGSCIVILKVLAIIFNRKAGKKS